MAKHKIRILTIVAGASINLLLFFVKLYIGLSVNSIAIYADSLNSLMDFGVCSAAVIGIGILSSKRSEKYPFGLGRAEELTDLLISAVILITGASFAYMSLERLMYPAPIWFSSVYAVMIAGAAIVKLFLVFFYKSAYKKTGSSLLNGLATDSLLDFFITLCALLSFTVSEKLSYSVDGIAGLIISIILLAEGVKMTVSACQAILGKRNGKLCGRASEIILADSSVVSVHKVECHSYGEMRVFTADISAKCDSAAEFQALERRLRDAVMKETDSQLYLSFGGASNEQTQ